MTLADDWYVRHAAASPVRRWLRARRLRNAMLAVSGFDQVDRNHARITKINGPLSKRQKALLDDLQALGTIHSVHYPPALPECGEGGWIAPKQDRATIVTRRWFLRRPILLDLNDGDTLYLIPDRPPRPPAARKPGWPPTAYGY